MKNISASLSRIVWVVKGPDEVDMSIFERLPETECSMQRRWMSMEGLCRVLLLRERVAVL